MNNNHLIGIVAVLALVAGGWYLASSGTQTEDAPIVVETVTDTVTNADESDSSQDSDGDPMTDDSMVDVSIDSTVDTSAGAVSFNVEGTNHQFSVKNMTVKKGQTVTINFANGDGMHDWVLDTFEGARTPVIKTGEKSSITFVADEVGTFEYYCSVGNHRERGMVGTFVVTE